MAVVTVEIRGPAFDVAAMRDRLTRAAVLGMDAELPSQLTEIVQSGAVPTNTGALRRAVATAAQPARVVGDTVVADVVYTGSAAIYGPVQDLGRTAGRKMSWKVLYYGPGTQGLKDGWKSGWVNRARRQWVQEVAASLEAADAAAGKRSRRKRTRKAIRDAYERRACYLLAVSIASRIRASGMRGKAFLESKRQEIADAAAHTIADLLRAEFPS